MNTQDFARPFAGAASDEPSAPEARCKLETSDVCAAPSESATPDRSSERRSKFIVLTS